MAEREPHADEQKRIKSRKENEDRAPERQYAEVRSRASKADEKYGIDDSTYEKIKRCFKLANEGGTQGERDNALRTARRHLKHHNIKEADIIARAAQESGDSSHVASQSIVDIKSNKANVRKLGWIQDLASAIRIFFDVKYFTSKWVDNQSQKTVRISYSFYGIATNTIAAALAFKMVVNLCQDWAFQLKKGSKDQYRLGVAQELTTMAYEEKRKEKQRLIEQESAARTEQEKADVLRRQQELVRLEAETTEAQPGAVEALDTNDPKVLAVGMVLLLMQQNLDNKVGQDSNSSIKSQPEDDLKLTTTNEEDLDDGDNDDSVLSEVPIFDNEVADDDDDEYGHDSGGSPVKRGESPVKPEPVHPSISKPKIEDDDTTDWNSAGALEKYRDNALQIAEKYMKSLNMKLKQGRKRNVKIRDQDAYQKGREDAKKIDVHSAGRQAIEE